MTSHVQRNRGSINSSSSSVSEAAVDPPGTACTNTSTLPLAEAAEESTIIRDQGDSESIERAAEECEKVPREGEECENVPWEGTNTHSGRGRGRAESRGGRGWGGRRRSAPVMVNSHYARTVSRCLAPTLQQALGQSQLVGATQHVVQQVCVCV